jgi:hypothetical protein
VRDWIKDGLKSGSISAICLIAPFPVHLAAPFVPIVFGFLAGRKRAGGPKVVVLGIASVAASVVAVAAIFLAVAVLTVAGLFLHVDLTPNHFIFAALFVVGAAVYTWLAGVAAFFIGRASAAPLLAAEDGLHPHAQDPTRPQTISDSKRGF